MESPNTTTTIHYRDRGGLELQRLESESPTFSSPPSSVGLPSPSTHDSTVSETVSIESPSCHHHHQSAASSSSKTSTTTTTSSSSSARSNGDEENNYSTSSLSNYAPSLPSKQQLMDETAQLWQHKKPDAKLKVRTLCLVGAVLPGLGCYICIAYTYLFQLDKVMNFTSTNCPEVKSHFPPVSYSIGVWKPQKYFWLMILAIHLPARLCYGIVCKNQYFTLGDSVFKERTWYRRMIHIHVYTMLLEGVGLVAVSVIDIETYFAIHALCFSIWVISFDFNMLFNTILHHHSGVRELTPSYERTFYAKCGIFLIAYPLSWSTAFSYASYALTCSALAYALFSIAEYILVGLNSLFYFLLVLQLPRSKVEIFLKHGDHICRNEITL